MTFWKLAYDLGWIDKNEDVSAQKLRLAVITEANPHGDITPEQYKQITGKNF